MTVYLRSERVEFEGFDGDRLAARLDRPTTEPEAFAVFAHCFTCSKDIAAASRISRALAARGVGTLRFDFTGLGHSDGEFANTNFSSNVEDLVAACAWLRETHQAPYLLVGHSLGGAAVLAGAARIPEVKAIATIGAPSEPGHVAHLLETARHEIEQQGEAHVSIAGRPFRVKQQFLDDVVSHDQHARIRDLGRALMIFHAPDDDVVGIDHAAKIYAAARHPKAFVGLDKADHLLTRAEDATFVADLLAVWSARYR